MILVLEKERVISFFFKWEEITIVYIGNRIFDIISFLRREDDNK